MNVKEAIITKDGQTDPGSVSTGWPPWVTMPLCMRRTWRPELRRGTRRVSAYFPP